MKDFKAVAKEMRETLKRALTVGPINELDKRLETLLNDFESAIVALADDEALRRAKIYYEQLEGTFPDGIGEVKIGEPED